MGEYIRSPLPSSLGQRVTRGRLIVTESRSWTFANYVSGVQLHSPSVSIIVSLDFAKWA